jgi:hypothetical protein
VNKYLKQLKYIIIEMKSSRLTNGATTAVVALVLAIGLVQVESATDCYNFSVTQKSSYFEVLPLALYYDKIDWIKINAGASCSFNTFSNYYFEAVSSGVSASAIPYDYNNNGDCILGSGSMTHSTGTWKYANSFSAVTGRCGWQVTVSNSGSSGMFEVIRTSAATLAATAVVGLFALLS